MIEIPLTTPKNTPTIQSQEMHWLGVKALNLLNRNGRVGYEI